MWPNSRIKGAGTTELRLPSYFEALAEMVTEEGIAESIVCGPDPELHIRAIQEYVNAGFSHVYVHQVGPDQDGFFQIYGESVLPHFKTPPGESPSWRADRSPGSTPGNDGSGVGA